MSAGALPDVVSVKVFDTVEAAIADCGLVIATTARARGMEKPVLGAGEAVSRIGATPGRATAATQMAAQIAGKLVEIIELPKHPFFIASQFHPEFHSKPHQPHPFFRGFIAAAHARIHSRTL